MTTNKMKANHDIKIKVTKEEHDKIKANAEKLGLTMKQYLLYVALNIEVKIEMKSRGE